MGCGLECRWGGSWDQTVENRLPVLVFNPCSGWWLLVGGVELASTSPSAHHHLNVCSSDVHRSSSSSSCCLRLEDGAVSLSLGSVCGYGAQCEPRRLSGSVSVPVYLCICSRDTHTHTSSYSEHHASLEGQVRVTYTYNGTLITLFGRSPLQLLSLGKCQYVEIHNAELGLANGIRTTVYYPFAFSSHATYCSNDGSGWMDGWIDRQQTVHITRSSTCRIHTLINISQRRWMKISNWAFFILRFKVLKSLCMTYTNHLKIFQSLSNNFFFLGIQSDFWLLSKICEFCYYQKFPDDFWWFIDFQITFENFRDSQKWFLTNSIENMRNF